jgi:hypothetical protein
MRQTNFFDVERPPPERPPLVVAYGVGVDSTAMLVGLHQKGYRPDLILFADVGGEKPETYAYIPVMQKWLAKVGFPPIVTVRYRPQEGHYTTLEESCLVLGTLPSWAFHRKGCSLKWKRDPQDRYVWSWEPAVEAWRAGLKVSKCIGFDCGSTDQKRGRKLTSDRWYNYIYPLIEWKWDRERCIEEIRAAGLPVPVKSACFFCPSTKPEELIQLHKKHPDLCERIKAMETAAAPRQRLRKIKGLWGEERAATKNKPASTGRMTDFLELLDEQRAAG